MKIDKTFTDIIRKEKTPAYIFDAKMLRSRIAEIRKILGENISLCYSIKANPFVIPELGDIVDKLEVCSPGELDICEKLNLYHTTLEPKKIIYSGVNKTYENVVDAFRVGVGEYTAESIRQAEIINQVARENDTILPVLLRLNAGSQFGMSKEDIIYIIKNRNIFFQNIDIIGIHYFAGTQRKNSNWEKQKKELKHICDFCRNIEEDYHFKMKKIEYGPGLPVPLFENDDYTDTLLPLREMSETFQDMSKRIDLTIEMGRFIVSECGYYVTRLMDKKTANGTNYAIFDGGINHVSYFGQIMGMKTPIIYHLDENGEIITDRDEKWAICGSLCTTNDDLVRLYQTAKMNTGDYFVFCNIGAYSVTEGLYLFLSRTLPKIIVYNETDQYIVRRDFMETSETNTPILKK